MQGTQKLAANRTRKLQPEEIDWSINRMIEKFMNNAITLKEYGYYEINERYAQAIAPLKETAINVPAYDQGNNLYKVLMPADFRYMVSPGVVRALVCENTAAGSMTKTDSILNVYAWDLRTIKSTPTFWQTFSLIFPGGSISNATFSGWTGYKTNKEVYQFANLIQESLWAQGINAFFETYDNLYYPGFLLIPGSVSPLTAVTIDGTLVTQTIVSTGTVTINDADVLDIVAGRILRGSVSHTVRTTPYYKTQGNSPLLEEHRIGGLLVYADNTFTVRGLECNYLRKPRKVDVSLQRGCDLHPSYHKTICNMVVEDTLNMIGSAQWQSKVQSDNMPQTI